MLKSIWWDAEMILNLKNISIWLTITFNWRRIFERKLNWLVNTIRYTSSNTKNKCIWLNCANSYDHFIMHNLLLLFNKQIVLDLITLVELLNFMFISIGFIWIEFQNFHLCLSIIISHVLLTNAINLMVNFYHRHLLSSQFTSTFTLLYLAFSFAFTLHFSFTFFMFI